MTTSHVITIHPVGERAMYGQCSCSWGTNIFAKAELNELVLSHFEQVGLVVRV